MALIDEATEVTEEQFNKLNLSLRDKDANIKLILVFNPSHKDHFIYKRFYQQMDVEYDFNRN